MSDSGWNFADVWEAIADLQPDATALVHGGLRTTWADFDQRADGVARWLLDLGAEHQDKVAQYLYNCPEYLEAVFATFKAGLVPVNTNYRYGDEELVYLWDNADAIAVVFHGCFADRIAGLRERVPRVHGWLWVDDGSGPCPEWASPYEEAATAKPGRTLAPWRRSGEDIYMLYTGGTTGMPKGVMWRQHDLFGALNSNSAVVRYTAAASDEAGLAHVKEMLTADPTRFTAVPACPLMHGTGAFTAFTIISTAGIVATLTNRTFDVEELLDTIERDKVNAIAIVGDAFAKPMLRALDAAPDRWDISSLFMIVSSGVMWSEETKQGLLRHHGAMLLVDAFSSSEALGMGQSVSSGNRATQTATFVIGENARVITDDGRDVEPGSGEPGMLAVKGRTPVGYYKDAAKSAATFRVIDGERYSVPGDWGIVESDGALRLLGRGSVCINTGGEKVFPEEVEEVIKVHPAVRDAVVVGVPDERFGEAISAMVEAQPGTTIDESDIVAHVKSKLASFKAPKRVFPVDTIGRAPNGKVDYKRFKEEAVARVGSPS